MTTLIVNGIERHLGNNPAPLRMMWPLYGDDVVKTPIVPRSRWRDLVDAMGGPGIDVPWAISPVHDQNGYGMCLKKDAQITMGDGTRKAICDVRVLDEVLTAEGNVRRVLKTMVRPYVGEMRSLTVCGVHDDVGVTTTPEHPILTEEGYKSIEHICARADVSGRTLGVAVSRQGGFPFMKPMRWHERTYHAGYVFNLEVEGDNSYTANGIGVHNCNASATVSAMEAIRTLSGHTIYIPLSGGDLYGRINGGSDRGSLLEDGLAESMKGVASVAVVPYLDWRNRPAGAAADRKNYVVLEAFLCPTFDACYSAVLMGFQLISGVMWYSNYEPSQDGWLPRGRGQGGGHAVHGYKPTYRVNGGSIEYGIWHKNSWKASWGLNGRCVFPEFAYDGPVGGWWAARVVTDTEGNIPPLLSA